MVVVVVQTSGERVEISWRQAEEHARTAVAAGQSCKPPEPALEASPLTTLGDIASAMCKFSLAKQRYDCLCLMHSKSHSGTERLKHAESAIV